VIQMLLMMRPWDPLDLVPYRHDFIAGGGGRAYTRFPSSSLPQPPTSLTPLECRVHPSLLPIRELGAQLQHDQRFNE